MGAYNILNTQLECQNCHSHYQGKIQFKFGDTWQFEFSIGDKIKWGGADIGNPGLPRVKVYGILESGICPQCGYQNIEDYDIYVTNDIIKSISPILEVRDYDLEEGGNYFIFP